MRFNGIREGVKLSSCVVPPVKTDADGYLIGLSSSITWFSEVFTRFKMRRMGRRMSKEEGVDSVGQRVGEGRFPTSWRS